MKLNIRILARCRAIREKRTTIMFDLEEFDRVLQY